MQFRRVAILSFFALFLLGQPATAQDKEPKKSLLLGKGWGAEHIIVMVKNHATAIANFEALGFLVQPPQTVSRILRDSLIQFDNGTFLELTSFSTPIEQYESKSRRNPHKPFLDRYASFVKKHDGAQSIGINVSPAKKTIEFLRSKKFAVADPVQDKIDIDGNKPKESPDTAEWQSIDFAPGKSPIPGDVIAFLEYRDNDLQQNLYEGGLREGYMVHANKAVGIRYVWVVVKNLAAATQAYKKVGFGVRESVQSKLLGASGRYIEAGRMDILLLEPKGPGPVQAFLKERGEGIMGVSIELKSILSPYARIQYNLRERVQPPKLVASIHGRSFIIPASVTNGLLIEFFEK